MLPTLKVKVSFWKYNSFIIYFEFINGTYKSLNPSHLTILTQMIQFAGDSKFHL